MKLKLNQSGEAFVLEVTEELDSSSASILKVGLSKLVEAGKSKLVLYFKEPDKIPNELYPNLILLHNTVAEKKGVLSFVGNKEALSKAIKETKNADSYLVFNDVETAIKETQKANPAGPLSKAEQEADPNLDIKNQLKQLETENKKLKEKLSKIDLKSIKRLRFENSTFEKQIRIMQAQIKDHLKERKKPVELKNIELKIQQLEDALHNQLVQDGLTKE